MKYSLVSCFGENAPTLIEVTRLCMPFTVFDAEGQVKFCKHF